MSGFVFFLMGVVGILAIILAIILVQKTSQAWASAAKTLGLQYAPGGFMTPRCISGLTERGFVIEVTTVTRGSGKHSKTYTCFRVRLPRSLGLGLQLSREGFFSGITKFFGAQDIDIGDEAFDNGTIVKGENPRKVMAFLTPARRARVARFLRSYSGAVIDDQTIEWSSYGVMREASTIVGCVRNFVGLGVHLIDDCDEDRSMEHAIKAQHDGKLDEAYAIVKERHKVARKQRSLSRQAEVARRQAKRSRQTKRRLRIAGRRPKKKEDPARAPEDTEPPSSEVPELPESVLAQEAVGESATSADEAFLLGGLLYLAGRKEEAREAFEDAAEEAPEDPEIRGWAMHLADDHAAEPSPSVDVAVNENDGGEAIPEAVTESDALEAQSLCDQLFAEGRWSFDAAGLFDERYAGQRVSWSGKLKSIDSYSFDFVFGDSPGAKARVEVASTSANEFSTDAVFAVVDLPRGAEEDLRDSVGTVVSFEGTLGKLDGLMRNIFVSNGRLIGNQETTEDV